MTAPVLPITKYLTTSCSKSTKNRVLKAQFGNGYKQVAKDGLNSTIDIWQLQYMPLTGTNLATLRTFISTVSVDTWFTWTAFGEGASKKWSIVEDSVKESMFTTELVMISFTIEQRFDLGT